MSTNLGAIQISKPFNDCDSSKVHPITLKFSMEPMGFDASIATKRERGKLRRILKKELPNAQLRIIFDIAAKSADKSCLKYPDEAIHPSLRGPNRPAVPAYLFHAHGEIFDPDVEKTEIRRILQKHYPTANRICFSNRVDEYIDEFGNERGGSAGWGEYITMEKMVVDFPDGDERYDNVAVVADMIRIRNNWPKNARRMSFGVKGKPRNAETNRTNDNQSKLLTIFLHSNFNLQIMSKNTPYKGGPDEPMVFPLISLEFDGRVWAQTLGKEISIWSPCSADTNPPRELLSPARPSFG